MSAEPKSAPRRVLQVYYAATIVFLMLDYGADLNVRIAGLEGLPQLKAGYYVVIFACFGLMLWRPARRQEIRPNRVVGVSFAYD